ncbi:hypothetical protein [Flammeovirga aprica]|uniref:Helix-turn-helix domain-containing protein n=1 Tax=Flammeovirga aprica JL-4 TaxID=694437 RepID=A0A7X9S1S2_9BACT|nr:hypothetical protein [Flammeovirga aprica]NME72799.1 hypothetical protein [Flammeovirga aprica JL-4]
MDIQINNSRHNSYSIFDNSLWKNNTLSVRAKYLHHYLANRPEGWIIQQTDLRKILGDRGKLLGEKSLRRINKELVEAGYMKLTTVYCSKKKRAKGKKYLFSPQPIYRKQNDAVKELVAEFQGHNTSQSYSQQNRQKAERDKSAVSANDPLSRNGKKENLCKGELLQSASISNYREAYLVNNEEVTNNKSSSLELSLENDFEKWVMAILG